MLRNSLGVITKRRVVLAASLDSTVRRFHSDPAIKDADRDLKESGLPDSVLPPTTLDLFRDGKWPQSLSKESITADNDFNRWAVVPASFAVQVSIGSVYAWSMWNEPLTKQLGVVASSSQDWGLAEVVPIFSCTAAALGATTFFLGPWAERSGPAITGGTAAVCYSTACILSGVGALYHQLPLIMLGYGLFGGVGWGLGYISPVSTLMRWFPDRRGMATGLALSAFGGGAVLAAPMIQSACNYFAKAPEYMGKLADVDLIIQNGIQYVEMGGQMKEVVVATAADLVNFPGLSEGVYLVGTGSTGAGEAFIGLGVAYGAMMSLGALGARVPAPGWAPPGYVPLTDEEAQKKMISSHNVDHHQALYTPQFYLLWVAVAGNAVAGMAVISNAKMMMGDVFGV
ncbi:hypothetical protein N9U05_00310, partial [bacterium]|nr:hypothetical protein [bacterium]